MPRAYGPIQLTQKESVCFYSHNNLIQPMGIGCIESFIAHLNYLNPATPHNRVPTLHQRTQLLGHAIFVSHLSRRLGLHKTNDSSIPTVGQACAICHVCWPDYDQPPIRGYITVRMAQEKYLRSSCVSTTSIVQTTREVVPAPGTLSQATRQQDAWHLSTAA